MITRLFALACVLVAALLLQAPTATAHPHVWVTASAEILFAPDGSVIGVRHKWTFDEMYSAFATQDLQGKEKGKFTREELAPLAEVNMSSLKEYDYFTLSRADGQRLTYSDPKDFWLEYKDSLLTLYYTLPFAKP